MSKKNKLRTRQNAHAHALQREKEQRVKQATKAEKTAQKLQSVQQPMKKSGSSAPAVRLKIAKRKRRGPRLIKGAMIRGIKVTDAESKRKIRSKLAQELEEKMDLDDGDDGEGWQEMTADEAALMQS